MKMGAVVDGAQQVVYGGRPVAEPALGAVEFVFCSVLAGHGLAHDDRSFGGHVPRQSDVAVEWIGDGLRQPGGRLNRRGRHGHRHFGGWAGAEGRTGHDPVGVVSTEGGRVVGKGRGAGVGHGKFRVLVTVRTDDGVAVQRVGRFRLGGGRYGGCHPRKGD